MEYAQSYTLRCSGPVSVPLLAQKSNRDGDIGPSPHLFLFLLLIISKEKYLKIFKQHLLSIHYVPGMKWQKERL